MPTSARPGKEGFPKGPTPSSRVEAGATHVNSLDREISRFFSAVGKGLFEASVVWLAYLGLEPYVRRFSPDSLIAWTRLLAGGWRDPRVGRDVMIGVAAGLGMTVVFAVHNLLPPLFGQLEPMPVPSEPTLLMSTRYVFASILTQLQKAMASGMLGIAGYVAFRMLLKRRFAAMLAAIVCYAGVVMNGMFIRGRARRLLPGLARGASRRVALQLRPWCPAVRCGAGRITCPCLYPCSAGAPGSGWACLPGRTTRGAC
jgi:hypothetical protein